MNGVSERDAIFLNEMGLGPLWQLRTAPASAAAAVEADVAIVPGPTPLQPVAQSASALAPVAEPAAPQPVPWRPAATATSSRWASSSAYINKK